MNCSRSADPQINDDAVRALVAERTGRDWCLFVDRDGVINVRIVGDYVRRPEQFEFVPGAIDALVLLRDWAPHLVVVTNQQGIGKGYMSEEEVAEIHRLLQSSLGPGCVIDEFLVCPHLETEGCLCRKPKPSLVVDWLRQHPRTEARLSIMVGDSRSDIELAGNVSDEVGGCAAIGIGRASADFAEVFYESLWDLAVAVQCARNGLA